MKRFLTILAAGTAIGVVLNRRYGNPDRKPEPLTEDQMGMLIALVAIGGFLGLVGYSIHKSADIPVGPPIVESDLLRPETVEHILLALTDGRNVFAWFSPDMTYKIIVE